MKTFYAILALSLAGLALLMADADHGSQRVFAESIRAASQHAQK